MLLHLGGWEESQAGGMTSLDGAQLHCGTFCRRAYSSGHPYWWLQKGVDNWVEVGSLGVC